MVRCIVGYMADVDLAYVCQYIVDYMLYLCPVDRRLG